jgi:hypothetical protein
MARAAATGSAVSRGIPSAWLTADVRDSTASIEMPSTFAIEVLSSAVIQASTSSRPDRVRSPCAVTASTKAARNILLLPNQRAEVERALNVAMACASATGSAS